MAEDPNYQEPYRATRLWNEVILAFRTGMPLQKHRHHIRQYESCFTASDCVSWLNCYLKINPNFGPHVTRQQTVQLLQKFLKCRVIESAIGKSEKTEFKDNSHLYRFVQYTPTKSSKKNPLLRTPLSVRTNNLQKAIIETSPISLYRKNKSTENVFSKNPPEKVSFPECRVIEPNVSVQETEDIWKSVFLDKIHSLINPLRIQDYCEESVISARNIIHNATRVSKTGVVILIDKTDDIPHWVISAMKCLANWPEASGTGSCLPKYPGFEKDVFNVIKDYFLNPEIPLVPAYLQSILVKIYCHFMHQDCENCVPSPKQKSESNSSCIDKEVKMSTPLEQVKLGEDYYIRSKEGKLLLDDSGAMWENPLSMCFETEFIDKSPITRLIPNNPSDFLGSFQSLNSLDGSSVAADTLSTMSACSYPTKYANKAFNRSLDAVNDKANSDYDFYYKKFQENADNLSISTIFGDSNKPDIHQQLQIVNNFPTAGKYWTMGSHRNKITTAHSESSISHLHKGSKQDKDVDCENTSSLKCTTLPRNLKKARGKRIKSFGDLANEDEPEKSSSSNPLEDMKTALQLTLLSLPISNRRQIHLLLRMLNKISRNDQLISESAFLTKEFLLETFLPAVLDLKGCLILNKDMAYEVFAYLMEECESIMTPPSELGKEAHKRLYELKRIQIKYSLDDVCLTYCEMISQQQYEHQKIQTSHQALSDLLNKIIEDGTMSEKIKRRNLKQFKIMHPDIYYKRFPNSREEEKVLSKRRVPLLTRFFSMRM